jgi:uncharacterized protein YecE (DUF72 family)
VIRCGPAGWSYPDSPGYVYPTGLGSRFDALAFLAGFFDTIEINSTFYAPQPPRNFASWARRVAANPDFRFAVKLWRRFTHPERARSREPGAVEAGSRERGAGSEAADEAAHPGVTAWSKDEVRQVAEGLAVLRDEGRLGAVLAQFPWSFKPSAEARDLLRRLADDFADWPLVVELRHGGWDRAETLDFLRAHQMGLANIDQPIIGRSIRPSAVATGPIGYVRFHGRNYERWIEHEESHQRYDYLYSAEELRPWVERIRKVEADDEVRDVYVITNNHFRGKGPANALMLRSMLEGRKVGAPPTLFDTYRAALEPHVEPGRGG